MMQCYRTCTSNTHITTLANRRKIYHIITRYKLKHKTNYSLSFSIQNNIVTQFVSFARPYLLYTVYNSFHESSGLFTLLLFTTTIYFYNQREEWNRYTGNMKITQYNRHKSNFTPFVLLFFIQTYSAFSSTSNSSSTTRYQISFIQSNIRQSHYSNQQFTATEHSYWILHTHYIEC